MDGDRYERQLVVRLDLYGYAVMRAPASGAATQRDLPDLTASKEYYNRTTKCVVTDRYAIEAKAWDEKHLRFTEEEVVKLCTFATTGGYTPMLGGRWSGDTTWYFRRPADTYQTDGGNYRLTRPDPDDPDGWKGWTLPPHPDENE